MKRSLLFAATLTQVLMAPALLFAQDAVPVGARAAALPKGSSDTLWHLIQSGGMVMIPLALMSVLMVMLILAYAITLRRGAVLSNQFMNTAEVLMKKGDLAGLLAIANRHNEAIARIIHRMLDFSAKNPHAPFEVVREIAQTEGSTQAASLQNRITYLADIAVLSPMVGLLGTVFGIIRCFGDMSNAVADSSRMKMLSGGVSEALFATGAGLIIGIISMAFYGIFRNKVQSLLSELERASAHLLGLLSLHFNPREQRESRMSRYDEPERTQNQPQREFKIEPRRRAEEPRDPQPPAPRRPGVSVEDEF